MIKTTMIAMLLLGGSSSQAYWYDEPVDYTQFTYNVVDTPSVDTISCRVNWSDDQVTEEDIREYQAEVDAYNESNGYF